MSLRQGRLRNSMRGNGSMENKFKILVVEDDRDIREGIEIYLRNQGYQVFQAANGAEGLKIVEQEELHLAIVDIMMPVMDGITMLDRKSTR